MESLFLHRLSCPHKLINLQKFVSLCMVTYARFLFIRPSQLTGAGKGLFTKVFIPKGSFVVEYKGRVTTWNAVKHDIDNDYLYYVNRQHVVNAKPYAKALGRFAN